MKIRYGEVIKDILLILAAGGVITVAATSPYFFINIAKTIIKSKKYNKKNNLSEKSLAISLSGLNKNKIIILKNYENKFTVELTEKGKKVVNEILFDKMVIKKQEIWDKKWRIVIFDIPERKLGKCMRNSMRLKLQLIGFYQLQKSVWVHPYPCEKEVQLICEIYESNPYVNIITAEKIYNDDLLIKYFKLKKQ